MEPLSRPFAAPQPDQAQYGVGELALFKGYTRESFRRVFGVQAPSYDPKRKTKTWFDSSVDPSDLEALSVYKVVVQDKAGNWILRQVGMPAREAASVNLPGDVDWPPYTVEPTRATRGGSPINPDYLSLQSEAQAIAAAIGAEGMVDEGVTTVFSAEFPADEARRMWAVTFRARSFNVGLMLKSRNAAGVATPGHWQVETGEPVWVPEAPPPSHASSAGEPPVWDMPCRDLLRNEKLQGGLFGPAVVRTDKQAEADLNSGKFLPADRQLLQQIWQSLQGGPAVK